MKRRLLGNGYCRNSIIRGVTQHNMVIISNYDLVEKEPGSGVFGQECGTCSGTLLRGEFMRSGEPPESMV